MYYPDMREYITFLFSLLDEFTETQQVLISRGRPKIYSDASLLVFYAMMTLTPFAPNIAGYTHIRSCLKRCDCRFLHRTYSVGMKINLKYCSSGSFPSAFRAAIHCSSRSTDRL